jgi:purine-nucleoside phosphorylase
MNTPRPFDALVQAARARPPEIAVVLGSGLGAAADRVAVRLAVPFAAIPTFPAAGVAGHRGQVVLGDWAGRAVLIFGGRLHFYEGHAWDRVLAPIRLAGNLGARALLLTNAAGGIRADLVPGTLMAITGHRDWTRGPGPAGRPGGPYSPRLVGLLAEAAGLAGEPLARGVYAATLGPTYETPAEVRALRAAGADAVGMSTVREAEAAAALGLEVAAVSCVTNHAAGLGGGPLDHAEVLHVSQAQARRLAAILEHFLTLENRRRRAE